MSADVVVLLNPLDVSRRRRWRLADDTPLIAWVDENEPAPGRCTRAVFVNGQPCADPAYRTHPRDEILVAFAPGDPVSIGVYFLQVIAAAAIAFIVGKIFAPKRPTAADTPQPSQVYGIAPPRNAARLGQPIPVIYGSVVALPDFASQPYTRFEGGDMFFYALLCLGQGDHDVSEMQLGATSVTMLPSVVQWQVYGPGQHLATLGTIESTFSPTMGDTTQTFAEDMVTSPAVADQELLASNQGTVTTPTTWYWRYEPDGYAPTPTGLNMVGKTTTERLAMLPAAPALGAHWIATIAYAGAAFGYAYGTYTATAYTADQQVPANSLVPPATVSGNGPKWIGPFESCKAGKLGAVLELDFVFPVGLYSGDGAGNLFNRGIDVQVGATRIDSAGNPVAAEILWTENFTANQPTPQRFTRRHTVLSGRYRVRAQRLTLSDGKVTTADRVIWAGLKHQLIPPGQGTPAYGNVTLIAVKMKATNGVASDAASSMRFRCTRRLAPLGSGAVAATVNPADAFVDVLCAAYGGARPVNADELDLVELAASRAAWANHDGFNAVFDQTSTVWEALTLAVQTVHAAPLPVGSRMSLIHDQVQPVRAQLFTDANIVAGSLQVTYAFDATGTPAGVRVNYRDPSSFAPVSLLDPPGAPDFVTVDLFGCRSPVVAQEHAALIQAKRRQQRATITFSTELEGLNILPGDRIGVQAGMVKWAQGARVEEVIGRRLVLTASLTWTPGATHAVQLRDPTGAPVRVEGVTPGSTPYELVLPADAPFPIADRYVNQEPTALSFGVVDQEVTDWSVVKITPNGATVTVEAVNYVAAIYAGAAAFTRGEPMLQEAMP